MNLISYDVSKINGILMFLKNALILYPVSVNLLDKIKALIKELHESRRPCWACTSREYRNNSCCWICCGIICKSHGLSITVLKSCFSF